MPAKTRAPRNRTINIDDGERAVLRSRLLLEADVTAEARDRVILGDAFRVLPRLAAGSYDLLFADPPYNLTKSFGRQSFKAAKTEDYRAWLDTWLSLCAPLLKNTASVYICADWRSGSAVEDAAGRYFKLRNRITWEREKGRGAKGNWKNASEDIWFFTVSDDYVFNADAVKQRRRVIAPYRERGLPKDWVESSAGNFRDTHASNLWTDISVPFWSMPENTDHPTQKPEKLLAKLILASTRKGGLILDPFAGSGTSAVAASKLGRHFTAIEADEDHCLVAQKRLEISSTDKRIQGFEDGVFYERNSGLPRN